MPDYHFVTEWDIPAPIDEVFRLIADSLRWPEWWRGVRSVRELAPGDANGIGVIRRYEWRSQLPCSLVFDMRLTVVEPPTTQRYRHRSARRRGPLVPRQHNRGHAPPLRVGRPHHGVVDESARVDREAAVRVEPRRRHAMGRARPASPPWPPARALVVTTLVIAPASVYLALMLRALVR